MKSILFALIVLLIPGLSMSAEKINPKTMDMKSSLKDVKVAPKYPDLVISNYRFELTGNEAKGYATLLNSGPEGAVFEMGKTMAELKIRGITLKCNAPAGGYFLGAGQNIELSTTPFHVAPGSYDGTWTANPSHVVEEKVFTNNVLNCHLDGPPPPALPDLVVSNIVIDPSSGPTGTVFRISIIVGNQGDATLPKGSCGHTLPWVKMDNGAYNFAVSWGIYKDIAPGQTITHVVSTNTPLAPGTHTISVELDRSHNIIEKHENNNTGSTTFTVTQ